MVGGSPVNTYETVADDGQQEGGCHARGVVLLSVACMLLFLTIRSTKLALALTTPQYVAPLSIRLLHR